VVLSFVVPRGFELVEPGRPVAWGTSGVKLIARRAPSLELLVLEAGTSEPIEDFAISLREDDALLFRNAGPHPQGRLRLEDLRRARYRLFVLPAAVGVQPAEQTVDVAGEATSRLTVFLARAATLGVRVSDAQGRAVAGSTVTLVDPKGARGIGATTAVTMAFSHSIFPYRPSEQPAGLHRAETDPGGEAVVRLPHGIPRLFIRVEGGGHAPLVRLLDAADLARGSVGVTVSPGARLHVLAQPESLLRYRPLIRLAAPDAAPGEQLYPVEGVALRGDGTCELAHAPPGDWDVFLCAGRFPMGGALRRVALTVGEVTRVELSLPHLEPGSFAAGVELDGAPAEGRVRLTPEPAAGSTPVRPGWETVQVAEGHVAFPVLAPGRYTAELLAGQEATGLRAAEQVEILPGVASRGTLSFRRESR
jgi:hypothetical protein